MNTQYGCSRRPFRRNRHLAKILYVVPTFTHRRRPIRPSPWHIFETLTSSEKRAYTPTSHSEMTITPSTTVTLYNTILPGHQKYSRTLFMTFYESTVSPKKISSPLESTFLSSPQYKIPTRLLLSPSFFLRLLQQNTTLTVLQQI